jgi:cytochrome c5
MRLSHPLRLLLPPSNLEAIENVQGAVGAVAVVAGVAAAEVRAMHTHDIITAQISLCQAATMARFAPIREQRTDHRPRIK